MLPSFSIRTRRLVSRIAVGFIAGLVLLFLIVPVVAIIPMSFGSSMLFELWPAEPGLNQYRQLMSDPAWLSAFAYSAQIALATTLFATSFGTLAALGFRRLQPRWRPIVESLLLAPYIVPTIVYAVGAYFVFSKLHLVGSAVGIALAHGVLALPVVFILVNSALLTLDPALEEASTSLGASPVKTFARITFPQIRLAIFAGALFSFHVSFDEVVVSLFLSGTTTVTLPVKIWNSIAYEITPILPAISTLIILLGLLILAPTLSYRSSRS